MPAIKLIFEQPVNERAAVIVGGIKSRGVGSSSVVAEIVRIEIRHDHFTTECALFRNDANLLSFKILSC